MPPSGQGRRWRLLDTGRADGSWNLALDEALFRLADRGRLVPTIRFYGWSPPALSVGYFQRWEKEIDPAACRRRGIAVYRRVTGGRAVYHGSETTYSVVCSRDVEGFSGSLLESYRKIAEGLAAGFAILGVPADLTSPLRHSAERKGRPHPSCFAAMSGYELSVGGKKLVGSAQKRGRGGLLQHGSILHAPHDRELAPLLRSGGNATPETASLESILGGPVPYGKVVGALRRGFEMKWGIELVPGGLEDEELGLAEELVTERYGSLTDGGPFSRDPVC